MKWLRKSEPSEAFDLGFDKILIDGISYAEIREESIENDHFPQIYTFRKRKCEIISKVSFFYISDRVIGIVPKLTVFGGIFHENQRTTTDRLRYLSDIFSSGKNLSSCGKLSI